MRSAADLLVAVALLLPAAPLPGAPSPPGPVLPLTGAAGLLFGRPLDLNRALPEDLEVLPGIGAVRAQALAAARARAPFCQLRDVLRTRGIGAGTLHKLRPFVVVRPPPGCPGSRTAH